MVGFSLRLAENLKNPPIKKRLSGNVIVALDEEL